MYKCNKSQFLAPQNLKEQLHVSNEPAQIYNTSSGVVAISFRNPTEVVFQILKGSVVIKHNSNQVDQILKTLICQYFCLKKEKNFQWTFKDLQQSSEICSA